MKYNYTATIDTVSFSGKALPATFFIILGQLDVYITLTGSKLLPYSVRMTESEFLSCIEMSKEM